jgi:carbonic anhydrase/acetyltransferase-like protein (isoleucine patch superfamily)
MFHTYRPNIRTLWWPRNLIVELIIIGERATIGLAATIIGDVRIDPDATILAQSVLMPGSRIGNGEVWDGVSARRII